MNAIDRALRATCAATLALCSLATPATAQTVDQSQLANPDFMAQFNQPDLAQSFKQANNNITGAEIELRAGIGSGAGDITISLWNGLPNAGGAQIATGTDFGVQSGEFATVSYGVVPIIPETTYFLVFTSTNSTLGINGSTNDPYPRGQVYANAGFQPFPTFDYTFQTFTLIPEPGSAALLGGLGLFALRRRVR